MKKIFITLLVVFIYTSVYAGVTVYDNLFVGDPSATKDLSPADNAGTVEIDGAVRLDGIVTIPNGMTRAQFTQEDLEVYDIPLYSLRAADGNVLGIADAEDAGDHYLSYSSGVFRLYGNSPNSDTQTDISSVNFSVPPEYVDGQTFTFRAYAEYSAEGSTSTIDLNAYEISSIDGSALGGTDLCSTASGTLSSDGSAFNFTITPTGISGGDMMSFIITTVFQDTEGSTGEAIVDAVQILLDIKG